MPSEITIRQAAAEDAEAVAEILREAAHWLEQNGEPLWQQDELTSANISADVQAGLFFLAESAGIPAATVRFQLEDPIFWPDAPSPDAAYIHRLAVRRDYAGQGLSTALLNWAADRTRSLSRHYLRLDCEASRPRLRAVYERFGFRHHSNKQIVPYFVSRYEYDVAT